MSSTLKKSGHNPWKSKRHHLTSVGLFALAAKKIYTAHPDMKDPLVDMIKVYGDLHDDVCREAFPDDPDAWIPLADVIIDRVIKK